MTGFYNRDEKCLLGGTNWVFKSSGLRFVFKGLIGGLTSEVCQCLNVRWVISHVTHHRVQVVAVCDRYECKQNNRCWCSKKLSHGFEFPLLALVKNLVCRECMQNQSLCFLKETTNFLCSVWLILTLFFRKLAEEEKCGGLLHAGHFHIKHGTLIGDCSRRGI